MNDFLKVDIHTHILPEKWPDLKDRYGYGGFIRLEHHKPCCARMMMDDKFFREVEDNCWDPVTRMHECDTHKVNVQVLSTVPVMFSYWAKPADTLDLSMILNDHISEVVSRYPDRFIGDIGVDPNQGMDAVRALEATARLHPSLPLLCLATQKWNCSAPGSTEIRPSNTSRIQRDEYSY